MRVQARADLVKDSNSVLVRAPSRVLKEDFQLARKGSTHDGTTMSDGQCVGIFRAARESFAFF